MKKKVEQMGWLTGGADINSNKDIWDIHSEPIILYLHKLHVYMRIHKHFFNQIYQVEL